MNPFITINGREIGAGRPAYIIAEMSANHHHDYECAADIVRAAKEAGADAISVVNTIPGLAIDVDRRRPALGFGTGGVSGPGLLPVGVLATWKVHNATTVPIIGIGGIGSADAILQYMLAGASLVAVGTGALKDPRLPERLVRDLRRWCDAHGVGSLSELVGTLQWPT